MPDGHHQMPSFLKHGLLHMQILKAEYFYFTFGIKKHWNHMLGHWTVDSQQPGSWGIASERRKCFSHVCTSSSAGYTSWKSDVSSWLLMCPVVRHERAIWIPYQKLSSTLRRGWTLRGNCGSAANVRCPWFSWCVLFSFIGGLANPCNISILLETFKLTLNTTMKLLTLALCAASASAFAPATNNAKSSALSATPIKKEIGVQPPVGFFEWV